MRQALHRQLASSARVITIRWICCNWRKDRVNTAIRPRFQHSLGPTSIHSEAHHMHSCSPDDRGQIQWLWKICKTERKGQAAVFSIQPSVTLELCSPGRRPSTNQAASFCIHKHPASWAKACLLYLCEASKGSYLRTTLHHQGQAPVPTSNKLNDSY